MRCTTALAVPVRRLSWSILLQFTLEMCTTAENHKTNTEQLYFEGLRSFKVISVDTIKKLVISACYDSSISVPICNCFHAR